MAPPNIGTHYATNFTMRADGTSSGALYASLDYTLFAQTRPNTTFPYQLNLGNHGQSETYVAYNPSSKTCNGGSDPLYCIQGQSCAGTACIALFDNPFLGLPDTDLDGLCQPSGANKWTVSNGGYTLTYCSKLLPPLRTS